MAEPLVIGDKRCLDREEAARYCDLSPSTFDGQVVAGVLPKPMPFKGRRRVWDRKALDAKLDELSGLAERSPSDVWVRGIRERGHRANPRG